MGVLPLGTSTLFPVFSARFSQRYEKRKYNQRVKYHTVESNHLFGALDALG